MQITKTIASRLNEVLLTGKWIANTNFQEQITTVSWQQAIYQIENLNTIALLTFHINYYIKGINEAFTTQQLTIRDKYSFDLSPIIAEEDWKNLVEEFLSNAEKLIETVTKLEDNILAQPFFEEKYGNFLRNLEGVIEHAYYHLGQISLIKKLVLLKIPNV